MQQAHRTSSIQKKLGSYFSEILLALLVLHACRAVLYVVLLWFYWFYTPASKTFKAYILEQRCVILTHVRMCVGVEGYIGPELFAPRCGFFLKLAQPRNLLGLVVASSGIWFGPCTPSRGVEQRVNSRAF